MKTVEVRPGRAPSGAAASRRWLRIALLVLGALMLAFALAVVATARHGNPALYPPPNGETGVTVYVVRNWLHASLAVPTDALRDRPGPATAALRQLPETEWVLLGWGDAKHFRERGETRYRALDLVRSLVVLDNPSVVSMDPEPRTPSPQTIGRKVVKLTLSRQGFDRLVDRLDASFTLDLRGAPVVAGRGRDPDSLFFYSPEGADFAHACNHWIADLLDAAGVPTTPVVDTVTAGLAWDLRLRAGAESLQGRVREPSNLSRETPPVYSGRFDPLSAAAERTGSITFEGYRLGFEGGPDYRTEPIRLVRASQAGEGGRTWAELLQVPADSLVEVRRVRAPKPGGPCGARPTERIALGFRANGGERYEIAVAAFASSAARNSGDFRPCLIAQYVQP